MSVRSARSFTFIVFVVIVFVIGLNGSELLAEDAGKSADNVSPPNDFLRSLWYSGSEEVRNLRKNLEFGVEVEEKYDDNIFRTYEGAQWDYITTVSPRVKYRFFPELEEGRSKLIPGITLDLYQKIYRYARNTHLNGKTNHFWFFPELDLEIEFDRFLIFFEVYKDQRFSSELYPDEDTSQEERERNVVFLTDRYGIEYAPGAGRYKFPISYEHKQTSFDNPEDKHSNFIRDHFSLGANVRIQDNVSVFLDGSYTIVDRPKMTDSGSKYKRVATGVRGNIGPKVDGTLSFGYTMAEDDNGKKTNSMVGDISLEYIVNPRFSLFVSAVRSIPDTTEDLGEGDPEPGQRKAFEAVHTGLSGIFDDTRDIDAQYAINDRFVVGFGYTPSRIKKLRINADVEYAHREYDTGTIEDIYESTVMASYAVNKNLRFVAKYEFKNKVNDIKYKGYTNNVALIKIILEF